MESDSRGCRVVEQPLRCSHRHSLLLVLGVVWPLLFDLINPLPPTPPSSPPIPGGTILAFTDPLPTTLFVRLEEGEGLLSPFPRRDRAGVSPPVAFMMIMMMNGVQLQSPKPFPRRPPHRLPPHSCSRIYEAFVAAWKAK